MKTQKFLRFVLLLLFAALACLVLFVYQNIQRNKESFQWVTHSHEVIESINEVRSSLLSVESQVRGYVLSGNPAFIQHYQNKEDALFRNVNKLDTLATRDTLQQKHIDGLLQLANQKIEFQNEVLQLYQHSAAQAQYRIAGLTGKSLTDAMEGILQKMEAQAQHQLRQRMQRNHYYTELRYTTTLVLSVGGIIFLAILLLQMGTEARRRRQAEEIAVQSERKYKELIENSALIVHATDLQGNFTYLSGKCKDFTGFTPEELLGEHYLTIIEESWQQKAREFYAEQLEKQIPETVLELPIVSKYGALHWIEQSTVLLQKNGVPTGFQSIAKDITEKKYAQNLLAEAEQRLKAKQEEEQGRLQAILDNMPMIVYLKDLEGRFMIVNRGFHQTFGTNDAQVLGVDKLPVHVSPASIRRFADADEQVKQFGRPVEVEDTLLTTAGERHMLIIKFPLYDKDGQLTSICAVGKDITEIVRYQRQLIYAKKRAERAERLQEEFLANMSHEIRTPMNGIIGMTNLLETTPLNTEQQEYLHLIQESSGILLSLINDILDLSKIKSGRMPIERVDYDLQQTISSLMAPFQVKAIEKGIRIEKIFQDLPQFVCGDQHKLQQVLNNLLSNAVKFTGQGAVTLFATTEKRDNDALYLVCTVSDTGIGISAENQEHVFESFVQAGTDMVRRYGGTGLGLSITKRLIELQGGKIAVSSTLGEGTSFYIELPLTVSQSAGQPVPVAPLEEPPATSLQGKKILLIEDNLVNQKVTCLMLCKAGLVVDIANHGKEAITLLQQNTYDLIITDLQMPEMDGFQTTAFIRNKLHLQLPIIAMTASALRNEKDRCLALGMNEYLSKPFAPAALFFHLKRLLLSGEKTGDTPETANKETTQLYNLSYLAEMEDEDYTAEVLEIFLTTTPVALHEMKEHTLREEWSEVHKKAHSLKSSLGILQMNGLLQLITEIETLAKTGQQTDSIEKILQEAIQQYNLIKPMLEAERDTICKKSIL